MAKPFNPFGEFDFSKVMGELKMPTVDLEQVTTSYRKNVEAISAASQVAVEGIQAVVKRQGEIMREALEQYAKMIQEFSVPGSAEEATKRHAKVATQSFESTIAHMRELADMIAKSSQESLEVINARAAEMFEELKGAAKKPGKGKAA